MHFSVVIVVGKGGLCRGVSGSNAEHFVMCCDCVHLRSEHFLSFVFSLLPFKIFTHWILICFQAKGSIKLQPKQTNDKKTELRFEFVHQCKC